MRYIVMVLQSFTQQPYAELPERLGVGNPLESLKWFAAHGCGAQKQLSAAEFLVQGYQDSPARAAMLAALAGLHKKP